MTAAAVIPTRGPNEPPTQWPIAVAANQAGPAMMAAPPTTFASDGASRSSLGALKLPPQPCRQMARAQHDGSRKRQPEHEEHGRSVDEQRDARQPRHTGACTSIDLSGDRVSFLA